MVGKYTGNDENETLHEKYMSALTQILGSSSANLMSFQATPPMRSLRPFCRITRARATRCSSGVRKRAFSGESGKKKKATAAIATEGSPSTKNRTRQEAIAAWPEVIPYASAPAKHLYDRQC